MGRLVHTGLGSLSLVAHVLHYPPPPHANSFALGHVCVSLETEREGVRVHGTPARLCTRAPPASSSTPRGSAATATTRRRCSGTSVRWANVCLVAPRLSRPSGAASAARTTSWPRAPRTRSRVSAHVSAARASTDSTSAGRRARRSRRRSRTRAAWRATISGGGLVGDKRGIRGRLTDTVPQGLPQQHGRPLRALLGPRRARAPRQSDRARCAFFACFETSNVRWEPCLQKPGSRVVGSDPSASRCKERGGADICQHQHQRGRDSKQPLHRPARVRGRPAQAQGFGARERHVCARACSARTRTESSSEADPAPLEALELYLMIAIIVSTAARAGAPRATESWIHSPQHPTAPSRPGNPRPGTKSATASEHFFSPRDR
jgi:hypothetical protein